MAEEPEQVDNKVGNYELIEVIATGGSCRIWEITDGHQSLAMKLVLPEKLEEVEIRNSLKHEAKVMQSLNHPNCVTYRDSVFTKKTAYIVMEYFRAPNLKTMLKHQRGALHGNFGKLLEQVCLALGYMHENGWLHRDVKPDNILMNTSGTVRMIDFSLSTKFKTGLAKMVSGKVKSIQGTRTYIAPETILKKQPSPQTDMYSLGITLYECLTGRTPFAGSTPNDLLLKHIMETPQPPSFHNPNVTPEHDQFVLKLLSKKEKDRFHDMNEIASAVRSMKFFKEDPTELNLRRDTEQKAKDAKSYEEVLDSRKDAERTAAGITLPPRQKKSPVPKLATQPQAQQPQPQSMPPQGYPPPGYAYPPGYYPPYQPQPGAQMPAYPYPYPYPPQGYPQWGEVPPGQTPAPGQAPTGQGVPPMQPAPPFAGQPPVPTGNPPGVQAAPVQPPPPQKGAEKSSDSDSSNDDDLPLMEELPEVI
ncbi:MAG TPA: serine/threonine-protein kinase [Planctomycetaceae bacterium]|nr:serine/threonine-protein kinase [Planctomycetaceae bacterium]